MPSWKSLIPKKFMDPEDLPDGELVRVTIKGVRQLQFKGMQSPGQPPTVDIVLGLDLHGYPLPMRLNQPMCKRIEILLGTDDTALWRGQDINIYAGLMDVYGEPKPRIIIDDRPLERRPPAPAMTGAKTPALLTQTTSRISEKKVNNFRETAAGLGGSWDDFLAWCKKDQPAAYELLNGKDFDQISAGAVPVMKAYLDRLADGLKSGKKQLPAGDSAVPGELVGSTPAQRPAEPAVIPDDDIPF